MSLRLKKIKFLFFFIFLSLIFSQVVSAYIKTEVKFFSTDSDGIFKKENIQDISVEYYLENKKIIQKEPNFRLDPEKEIFCWSGCNIVPERYISKIDIKKEEELLSRNYVNIKEQDVSQIISVILDKKISQKSKVKENNIEANINFNSINRSDLIISYNGIFKIEEEKEYNFILNITGDSRIKIDNNIFKKNSFSINLTNGKHKINIEYWTSNSSRPNLLWDKNGFFEIIPERDLIYKNGSIKKKKEYGILSSPESYEPDYSSYPSLMLINHSISNNKTPLLLVHGLHGEYPYWNNIPKQLKDLGNEVWEFYYFPHNTSNFLNAGLLKNGIDIVLENYNLSKLDVVSHSMGGLVTMGYIHGLGKSQLGKNINYENNIKKIITIGSPLHGSYSANRILTKSPTTDSILCLIGAIIFRKIPTDTNAQAYLDLAIGSEFSWNINKEIENISGLNIAGNKGISCIFDETKEDDPNEPDATNDGLVTIASASLVNKDIPLIILDNYNHANEIGASAVPLLTFNADKEVKIINAFLKDKDPKIFLEEGDHYIDPKNQETNPYTKGSVILKILSDKNINTVSLKNNKYEYNLTRWQDLIHNTQTSNWFYFSNNNNLSYEDEKYGLTLPEGDYSLYINKKDVNNMITINPAETTMKLINLTEEKTEKRLRYDIKTNNSEGQNYVPIIEDIDNDHDNELIIFSNDNLIIYDSRLRQEASLEVGTLRGQYDVKDIDKDDHIEIIAVTREDNKDNFTIFEYDGNKINKENSFDVTSQGGTQDIICLDFDKDNNVECIYRDYYGFVHSYQYDAISKEDDELKIDISGESISSAVNMVPDVLDFDNDDDLDALFWFNNKFVVVDSEKNIVLDKFIGNLFAILQSDTKTFLGLQFVNLDNSGDYEILASWRQDSIMWDVSYKTDIYLALYNTIGNIIFKKDFDFWNINPCFNDNHHCIGYGSRFFITDYDGDGYDDVGIYLDGSFYSSYGTHIKYFNRTGGLIYSKNLEKDENKMHDKITFTDVDEDDEPELLLMSSIYNKDGTIKYNFTPSLSAQSPIAKDLDNNGALDLIWTKSGTTKIFYGFCTNDKDNDNICDEKDNIKGNSTNISTNIPRLNLYIDNNYGLGHNFIGRKEVELRQDNNTILLFDFNFSKESLDLTKLKILRQNNTNKASIIIKGLDLQDNITKSVFLDNLNTSLKSVCIKDTEISSIKEISDYCNRGSEFLIICNSTLQYNYNCSITGSKIKISGLKNSGVQQQSGDNTPPVITIISPENKTYSDNFYINLSIDENSDECLYNINSSTNNTVTKVNNTYFSEIVNSSDGSYRLNIYCNDTAGNLVNNSVFFDYESIVQTTNQNVQTSGSSGGGDTCNEDWVCKNWSDCIGGIEIRKCEDKNRCNYNNIKDESRHCNKEDLGIISIIKEDKKESSEDKEEKELSFRIRTKKDLQQTKTSPITGFATTKIKDKPNPIIGVTIILSLTISGIIIFKKLL